MSQDNGYTPKWNDLVGYYRQIFSTSEGQEVLVHMLCELGVMVETSSSPEDVALRNYGIRLLKILSGGEPIRENIKQFTKQLMRQPIPKEQDDD
jgi:hypothetical protein